MRYLAIDCGKREFAAGLFGTATEVLAKPRKFEHSEKGINEMLTYVAQRAPDTSKEDLMVGIESTAHYWINLFLHLSQRGFKIVLLNPLVVDSLKNQNVRGRKSEKEDCNKIAKAMYLNDFAPADLGDVQTRNLRNLTRFRGDLVAHMANLKRKVIGLLDQTFPEYEDFFSDTFGRSSIELLKEAGSAEEIAALDVRTLTRIVSEASRNRFGREKAKDLKEMAKSSFANGFAHETLSFEIQMLTQQIDFVEKQIKQVECKIEKLFANIPTQIRTIPGVGPVTAAVIHAEIGDIGRFKVRSGEKLLAFAGMDAKVRESGQYKGKVKMTKRGSPYLRSAIWQASTAALASENIFRTIYDKHKAMGEHHGVALSKVCNKMIKVIVSVWKNNRPFVENM